MTIIYLGMAWLAGLWIASQSDVSTWIWLAVGAAGLIAAVSLRRSGQVGLLLGILGILCLGAARHEAGAIRIDEGHVAHYNGQDDVVLTGLVNDEPEIHDRTTILRLKTESITLPGGEREPIEGTVQVIAPRFSSIPYGARVQITGRLEAPDEALEFDYRSYLARRGIYSQMGWPEITVLEEEQGNPVYQAIYGIKTRAQSTIHRLLPDPQAALLSGILLGNDDEIPPDLEEQFRISGLTHIIAISGFNIAILAGVLLAVSKPFLGNRRSAWFVLAGIALYTILVGADAAVVRAAIMGALFVIAARLMGRPTFAPAGLFTAAIIMTLANPFILWDVGFQLSFAATLGLMLFVGPWGQWAETQLQTSLGSDKARQLTRLLSEVVFATLAAMLFTLPIILFYFGQLSLIGPAANLFVLPAQPGVMIWGGLATLTGMVFPPLGQLFAWVAWLFLSWTIGLVRFFANAPFAAVPISISPAGIVALYALIFGLTWFVRQSPERRSGLMAQFGQKLPQRAAIAGLAIVALLAVAWAFSQPDGKLHVSFLDVGQGDATFIQTPGGRQILIDGGLYPSVLNDHLGREIPFWDRSVDLVIATHPDEDHIAGLPGVFERYGVGQLITNGQPALEESYQALLDIATESAVPIHQARAGEIIAIDDGVHVEVLNPSSDQSQNPSPGHDNDQSVALRISYGDFSLLLTGDAGEAIERDMLASGRPLSAVVYKAGHHGARSSSSKRFLDAIQPQYVIISAGEGNNYGHPHEEVLERAANVGAAVMRTDELGTIEMITDGRMMWWEAES